jgi:hypothetical protein
MMTNEQASRAAWDMLGAAVEGRGDDAARLMGELGADSDGPRMYGVCCGLAEAGRHALKKLFPTMAWSGYLYAIRELQPGGLEENPADTWAARFLVAWANHDTANTDALFSVAAAAPGDGFPDRVCALLCTVAGLIRSMPAPRDSSH